MSINSAALAAAQETERQLGLITAPSLELDKAQAAAAMTTAHVSSIPEPVKNAEFYGAKGDGVTDDTAALNAMFATGVAIFDQPGKTYLVDPVKRVTIAVNGTRLRILPEPGAVKFKAKSNSAARYRMFNVIASYCDLDVGGAHFIGDRDKHIWARQSNSSEDTHEWGYAWFLGGTQNRLYSSSGNAWLGKVTGDCLGVTGANHDVYGLTLEFGRRNGCSAFNAPGLKFHGCKTLRIGLLGQPDLAPKTLIGPFVGFDAEPDRGDCLNLEIYDNEFGPDCRTGLIGWINSRAAALTPTMRITGKVWNNTFVGCSNGTWFCRETAGATPTIIFELYGNRFVNNKNVDVKCDQGSAITIGNDVDQNMSNTFDDMRDQPDEYKKGFVNSRYEMQALRGAKVYPGWNLFV